MNNLVNLLILFALAACQVKTQDGASVIAVSSNYSTTLTATSTITADGVSASTISINVKKNGLAAAGETPTFAATGTSNIIGACSVTDANGDSTCSLKSTKAESKSVAVATPGPSLPAVVVFTAGSANSTNTTISASGPTVANGTAAATITVAVKDAFSNAITGVTPTFSATGTSNTYGNCSASNTSGLSTCALKSTKAEVKTLNLLTPVSKTGGTAIFMGGTPVAANTTITGTGPVIADGVSASTITVLFLDFYNNPSPAIQPIFTATDTGGQNIYGFCSLSGVNGISTCTLKSKTAETKTLSLVSPFSKSDGTVIFSPVTVVEANSSITGTSPVVANGIATSTITITLKDASNAPVSGVTPTFSATGSANSYGTCSSSNTSGISTCTLSSLTAETKTLSIATPIVKTGSSVVFTTPTADPANSSITGTSPVVANGTATSTITIILKDSSNNPVPGQTPTFTATGSSNTVGTCSATSVLGIASCTLASATAETKTLSIATPIVKIGGAVVFTSPIADPANSSITGTSPVVANGTSTSTITITLKDSSNNPVPGQTPTFSATGTTNGYGLCSATDATGASTCTMTSSTAETKTLSIDSPIIKSGGTVVFTSASASAANSSITGTGPVLADGSASSTVTIILKDASNNPVVGQTPTFSATGTSNIYGTCSASDATGASTCTMTSSKAEVKTLSIATPVTKTGSTVTFTAGSAVAANSSISGTSPVVADGSATSTVTITLNDLNNNPVAGETPTFSATGTTNNYGTCSVTDATGASTCTLDSTTAELKTLSIVTPVIKAGGNVTFTAGTPVAANSSITGSGPVVADGSDASTVTITLKDASNNPVAGQTPTFSSTGTSNSVGTCSATDATGVSTCIMTSTKAEVKTLSIATPVIKTGSTVTFTAGTPIAANSSITGSGPVVADGSDASTVTITLKDASNNPVAGQTPTFSSTGTSNSVGTCSATDATGVSTCIMTSTKAEVKTLSIATPVIKTGSTVTFTAGTPIAANSSITGSGPVVADGSDASTVTITLKDASNNPVAGQTPTFSSTGTSNSLGTCSASDATGVSTCTMTSTKAEVKTLSIATPVIKTGSTVTFTADSAVAVNSSITGSGPVVADSSDASTVTITLKDASNNPVAGQTPTFSSTGTSNSLGTCSATDATGVSTCTMTSTKAEVKTLSIATPVIKVGSTVTFTAGSPVAASSSITGTSPVVADGSATSTVTITLKDINNNPVAGENPTFSATGTTNNYGTCSTTDATGASTCTLDSTTAEIKTLSIATPVTKSGGTVTFTAGTAVAINSTISGTSPVAADGSATSTVTITLKDINNNPVAGQSPSFSATGTSNLYGTCTVTNATGASTCTMTSTTAEVKTLSIATPVTKTGSTVTFTAGSAVAANSSITGTGPVVANTTATSTVTITLKDFNNNPVAGQTPTFSATNTGGGNSYGSCSISDASGISTCTLASSKAEPKILAILTPVAKTGNTVTFTAGAALAANSSISGTSPVVANNSATSNVSIILRDAYNNPVSGVSPTFSATDTGPTNNYGSCTISSSAGLSSCTLASKKAETKTLSIASPFSLTGGSVVFTAGTASIANSSIIGTGPVTADGVDASTIIITLKDAFNNPLTGTTPTFTATDSGTGNSYTLCSATDSSGVSNCSLKSTMAETKTLSIVTPISKSDGTVVFNVGAVSIANSSITGGGPVVANGSATSTVTITLKDAANNPVPDLTPTFSATNTGTTNYYNDCSVTDAFGVSTCTFTSQRAETKTLSISTPIHRSGGTVVFTPGDPDATHSTITGSGPVVADGASSSTITITILDAFQNPISGEVPSFSATSTGTNTYTTCSATDSFGASTCTLKSTKAEIKTLSITSPVTKADGTVTFSAGTPIAANSHISGTGPTPADGSTASTITISLNDANNNAVAGLTPDFSASGTGNSYGACSASDATGASTCTLTSTNAETKTLSIISPFTKAEGTVQFIAGYPVAANSTISGTSTVVANGSATSTITITLNDASNNPVAGQTPSFSSTGTGNTIGTCSTSNASGISTCTLSSTKAEIKTLAIATPVIKTGGTVTFIAGAVAATYSTITGTTNIIADDVSTSAITITLYDANNNPVSGTVPSFTATNTGTTNNYSTCSSSDTLGVSTCTLKSKKAETKTLSIVTPVSKTGSTVNFIAGAADASHSDISGTGPVSADGISASWISITLGDAYGNPVVGVFPIFNATGTNNTIGACSASNSSGVATCSLASSTAEVKTLQLTSPIAVTGSGTVTFTSGGPVAVNSTITGTTLEVVADGSSVLEVKIILRDASNNLVNGWTPTFDATDTNSKNAYFDCSMSGTSQNGESICSMTSTMAEMKTLRITSPVTKLGGNVTFTAGLAAATNSSISGTSPVTANGSDISTITINLKDFYNNPVSGSVPTFSASGTSNTYGICSATDTSGNSTCTLKSTKAENKIPQILTPVSKSGGAISFVPDIPSAANSSIVGTSPINPDGVSTSTITITIRDANNNAINGTVTTFSASGATNTYGTCSPTDTSGISTCSLASTTAQTKTLSLLTPISFTGGTVQFISGSAVAGNSTITGAGPVTADGTTTSAITITLRDSLNLPVTGQTPVFTASGTGNTVSTCSVTNTSGISNCTLKSTKAEIKTLQITSPVLKTDGSVTFVPGAPSVANSTIVAAGPCKATGTDVCSVTITIKDAQGNGISGSTPTFSLSGTLNTLTACSVTNSSGASTCGATSTKAESKTFQLQTPVSVVGNSVDFNPNGINIRVPIELVDRGLASSTAAITFLRTRTTLNPADYVDQGKTYYFEMVAENANTALTYTVNLVNSLGTIVASIPISPSTINSKLFSVIWTTPPSSADDYRVQIPATSVAGQVKVHSARMVIEQTAAIATKIYIPLSQNDYNSDNSGDSGTTGQITSAASATYTTSNFMTLWTRDDSLYDNYDSGTPWTLEVLLGSSNITSTANATLFNKNGSAVTGATATLTNPTSTTTPYLRSVSFSSTATNFSSGASFELRINNSTTPTAKTTRLFKAGLWVKLKFLKKAEILYRIAPRFGTSTTTATIPDGRFYWDAALWSNPTVAFMVNGLSTTAGTSSSITLMDHGTNNSGTTGAVAVSGVGASFSPAASFGRQKSGALTINDRTNYILKYTVTSGTTNVLGSAFMCIQAHD